MTRIHKEDLFYYNNRAEIASFVSDNSKVLSNSIESFIENSSEKLIGKQFDSIRGHLMIYLEAYKRLSEISNLLANNMKAVNNKMLAYMGSYSEIDNSKIAEIERRVASIESLMNSMDLKNRTTNESEYYQKVLALMNQQKEKLLQLEPLDRELFDSFVPLMTDIRNLKASVNGIKTINADFK